MKYFRNKTDVYIKEPTVVTLGKFDGLHMGHKFLFQHLPQFKKEGLNSFIYV